MINGQTLQRLRIAKGLSQKDAANKIGITTIAYIRLEKCAWLQGTQLQQIIAGLNCSKADIEKAMGLLN